MDAITSPEQTAWNDAAASPVYRLSAVKKSYAGRTILDLDRLEILPGEKLAIVGPSGAGKSTLLRLLNFLETPDTGEMTYTGNRVGPGLSLDTRRQVTTVFQRPALLQGSVESNVAYGLRLRGKSDREQIEAALTRLGLKPMQKALARTLSGGEAQRVALARAMVIRPKVLLLDEPTANLDPYNVGLIERVVREINQEQQTTVVLVTHNIFQARRMADRVGLLLGGRLVELAPAREFFESPKDARTRAFVNGEMVY